MAGSVNKVILVGNLGADPDVRTTTSGSSVATFSIATSENWKDKNTGERKERTEWHRVVIFNEGLVKIAGQYLKKGMKVYVEGELSTRRWTDNAGIERFTTEVLLRAFNGTLTMLSSSGGGRGAPDSEDAYGAEPGAAEQPDLDDPIPF